MPRSMVYEALGRLHARGALLETSDGRATLLLGHVRLGEDGACMDGAIVV